MWRNRVREHLLTKEMGRTGLLSATRCGWWADLRPPQWGMPGALFRMIYTPRSSLFLRRMCNNRLEGLRSIVRHASSRRRFRRPFRIRAQHVPVELFKLSNGLVGAFRCLWSGVCIPYKDKMHGPTRSGFTLLTDKDWGVNIVFRISRQKAAC